MRRFFLLVLLAMLVVSASGQIQQQPIDREATGATPQLYGSYGQGLARCWWYRGVYLALERACSSRPIGEGGLCFLLSHGFTRSSRYALFPTQTVNCVPYRTHAWPSGERRQPWEQKYLRPREAFINDYLK